MAGNAQAKASDRDGQAKFECKRGDQYQADMAQTKVSHIFLLWLVMLRLKRQPEMVKQSLNVREGTST